MRADSGPSDAHGARNPQEAYMIPNRAGRRRGARRNAVSRALLLALPLLALAACGKKEAVETPSAAAASQAPVEGSPQLVMSADGVHIEYHVYGTGEPAVVLIHGWSCDGNYWQQQIAPLKAKYTTVTVDLAGHGASGANRADWSMGNFGEDVAAVVRQIHNQKVVLVGHSMGAPVALEAARRIGDRVIGIIAVDSLKTIGQPPMPDAQIEKMLKPFRDDFIGHTREFVTTGFFTAEADPKFVQKVAYDMSLEQPQVAIGAMQSLLKMDIDAILPEIKAPIEAINSDLSPTDEARIKKTLPNFKLITVPKTGHFLMMEAADRFNPILIQEVDALASRT
jgi:pimeloyl-ACP methyl ester carboxylesterase